MISTVLLCAVFLVTREISGASATNGSTCTFLTQPPQDLQCNPYAREFLQIECSINAPMMLEGGEHLSKVVWLSTAVGEAATLLEEGGNAVSSLSTIRAVDVNDQSVVLRSTLKISLNNQTSVALFSCHLATFLTEQDGNAVFQLSEPSVEMHLFAPSSYNGTSCLEDAVYFQMAPQNISFSSSPQNISFPLPLPTPMITDTVPPSDTPLITCTMDDLRCIFSSRKVIIVTATVGGSLLITLAVISTCLLVLCRRKRTAGRRQTKSAASATTAKISASRSEKPVCARKSKKVPPICPKRSQPKQDTGNGAISQQQQHGPIHRPSPDIEDSVDYVEYTEPGTNITVRQPRTHLPLASTDSDCQYVLPDSPPNRNGYQGLLRNQMNKRAKYSMPDTSAGASIQPPAYITPIA